MPGPSASIFASCNSPRGPQVHPVKTTWRETPWLPRGTKRRPASRLLTCEFPKSSHTHRRCWQMQQLSCRQGDLWRQARRISGRKATGVTAASTSWRMLLVHLGGLSESDPVRMPAPSECVPRSRPAPRPSSPGRSAPQGGHLSCGRELARAVLQDTDDRVVLGLSHPQPVGVLDGHLPGHVLAAECPVGR